MFVLFVCGWVCGCVCLLAQKEQQQPKQLETFGDK